MDRFDFGSVGCVVGEVLMVTFGMMLVGDLDVGEGECWSWWWSVRCSVVMGLWLFKLVVVERIMALSSSSSSREDTEKTKIQERRQRQSVQFIACLLAIYVHVPLLLSNVSIALPSALFWTPLISFPFYGGDGASGSGDGTSSCSSSNISKALGVIRYIITLLVLMCIWPQNAEMMLPDGVWSDVVGWVVGGIYFSCLFVPLYVMLSIQWLR